MKNSVLYAIVGVLTAAVIALFVLQFTMCKPRPAAPAPLPGNGLNVAFISMDTLLLNYKLYNTLSEELLQEEERMRANLNQKANALQTEMVDFQNKLENHAFLSEERARSEQERLLKKQQELQALSDKLGADLMKKRDGMDARIRANLDSAIKVFNEDGRYHYIFSNSGNILYGNPAYNVTNQVLELLNGTQE